MTQDITAIQYEKVVQQNRELQQEVFKLNEMLKPFEDEYFKGLSFKEIAGLAKTRLATGEELLKVIHLLEGVRDELMELDVSNSHISAALKKLGEAIGNEN